MAVINGMGRQSRIGWNTMRQLLSWPNDRPFQTSPSDLCSTRQREVVLSLMHVGSEGQLLSLCRRVEEKVHTSGVDGSSDTTVPQPKAGTKSLLTTLPKKLLDVFYWPPHGQRGILKDSAVRKWPTAL